LIVDLLLLKTVDCCVCFVETCLAIRRNISEKGEKYRNNKAEYAAKIKSDPYRQPTGYTYTFVIVLQLGRRRITTTRDDRYGAASLHPATD
jgi:hypothetical protein